MKYMLLNYDNPDTPRRVLRRGGRGADGEIEAIMRELTASGELVGTEALADPSNTKTVRPRDGVTAVTDGPFAEAKEHLGGYLILECSEERAVEIATR